MFANVCNIKQINMTFKEFAAEVGYEVKTTFWDDFSIADKFGEDAVKDTYKRVMNEWKENYVYLTELVLVLNHKIWQHFGFNKELALLYDELWRKAAIHAELNLQGDELSYYFKTID